MQGAELTRRLNLLILQRESDDEVASGRSGGRGRGRGFEIRKVSYQALRWKRNSYICIFFSFLLDDLHCLAFLLASLSCSLSNWAHSIPVPVPSLFILFWIVIFFYFYFFNLFNFIFFISSG